MPGSHPSPKREDGQRQPSYLLPAIAPLFRWHHQSMPALPAEIATGSASVKRQSFRSSVASAASSLSSSLFSPLSSSPSSSLSSSSSQSSTNGQTPSSLCTTPAIPIPERPQLVQDAASNSSLSSPPIFTFEPPQRLGHSLSPKSRPFDQSKRPFPLQKEQGGGGGGARHNRRVTRTAPDVLRCLKCSADIAFSTQIVSKGFTGRHGRAYLVSAPATCPDHLIAPEASPVPTTAEEDEAGLGKNLLVNIRVGRREQRELATGDHIVADIYCAMCSTKLGWKYVDARNAAQRYKVGKFILEVTRVAVSRGWEDVEYHSEESSEREDEPDRHASGDSQRIPMPASEYSLFDLTVDARKHTASNSSGHGKQSDGTAHDCPHLSDNDETIEFDSENDDECNAIFAGTWDMNVVAKKRAEKLASVQKTP